MEDQGGYWLRDDNTYFGYLSSAIFTAIFVAKIGSCMDWSWQCNIGRTAAAGLQLAMLHLISPASWKSDWAQFPTRRGRSSFLLRGCLWRSWGLSAWGETYWAPADHYTTYGVMCGAWKRSSMARLFLEPLTAPVSLSCWMSWREY